MIPLSLYTSFIAAPAFMAEIPTSIGVVTHDLGPHRECGAVFQRVASDLDCEGDDFADPRARFPQQV